MIAYWGSDFHQEISKRHKFHSHNSSIILVVHSQVALQPPVHDRPVDRWEPMIQVPWDCLLVKIVSKIPKYHNSYVDSDNVSGRRHSHGGPCTRSRRSLHDRLSTQCSSPPAAKGVREAFTFDIHGTFRTDGVQSCDDMTTLDTGWDESRSRYVVSLSYHEATEYGTVIRPFCIR